MKNKFQMIMGALLLASLPVCMISCGNNNDEPDEVIYSTVHHNPSDVTFTGVTTASLQMGPQSTPFPTEETTWRFVISNESNKCDVLIENARFAQKMPAITFKLVGLDYDPSMNIVAGADIVPLMLEAGQYTPAPNYTFDNFKAVFGDSEHRSVSVEYYVTLKMNGAEMKGIGTFISTGIL